MRLIPPPPIISLYWLKFSNKWNVASLKIILVGESLLSSSPENKSQQNVFSVLGGYVLQQLVLITLKFSEVSAVFCALLFVMSLLSSVPGWFVWTANKSCTNIISLSFSDWSSPRAFIFTHAVSLNKHFILLVNQHFYLCFPSEHCTTSPLHFNIISILKKP